MICIQMAAALYVRENIKLALPVGASAQKAELIALTRALELAEVQLSIFILIVNLLLEVLGTLWKEDGLLTVQGNHIKYGAINIHVYWMLFCFLAK